ncbi:unnamed protein product [Mycena citricolor]|uniref:methionyl-tRNA formyltransferase n=1 Tax=Mycena citricolor TaxID=2018698 RepID=A0AAD2HII7_9AGAR|nr:unnamed protein product [Mycena citricolor]
MLSARFCHRSPPRWPWIAVSYRHYRCLHTSLDSARRYRILFLGRDEFSCEILKALHTAQDVWEIISVGTNPDTKHGPSPLRTVAQSFSIPVHFIPPSKPEFRHWTLPAPFHAEPSLSSSSPPADHVLITASFGRILTAAQLDCFAPDHRLNVHGSVLPSLRGPAPIQHAILSGAPTTGVSIARMLKKGIDKGPVWATSQVPVREDATFTSLRDELADHGGKLLVQVLRNMLAGTAAATPQPPISPTQHARAITTADSILDFSTMTADDIVILHRAIGHQRALTTWLPLGTRLQLHDPTALSSLHPQLSSELILSDKPGALVYCKPARSLFIRCARDTVLAVPRVKKERRSMLEAREFWNGVIQNPRIFVDGEVRLVRMGEEMW